MKFATLGQLNRILNILDTVPQAFENTKRHVVELSEELATTVLTGMQAEPKVVYFYENGEVLTLQQRMEARQRVDRQQRTEARQLLMQREQQERLSAMSLGTKIELGESHVNTQGFGAARLVTCMDLLLQAKESDTLAQKPKLMATYQWLQTVKGTALAGSISFPPAPHTFEEVISE